MPNDEFRNCVKTTAATFAFLAFQRRHPVATAKEARRYARQCWRRYVDVALDGLAIYAVIEEGRAKEPDCNQSVTGVSRFTSFHRN